MTWIETFSGNRVELLDPSPGDIDIVDIAHALSNLCRFTGQCCRFYSVAEHSVWVCRAVLREDEREYALHALLHDAAEAYVADVSSPAKLALRAIARQEAACNGSERPGSSNVSSYDLLEERVWCAVASKFSIPVKLPPIVHEMDMRMLATERRVLMQRKDWKQSHEPILLPEFTNAPPSSPPEVAVTFLDLFQELQ